MLRVTAYTGGSCVPSARFRVRQYVPALRALGVALEERPAALGAYPPRSRPVRPIWAVAALAGRLADVAVRRGADVTLLQREMLSGFFTVERFTKRPRVLDVDDAIWRARGGTAAASLARACELVICGNAYVADFFRRFHPHVEVLATPVDTSRFVPAPAGPDPDASVIGWCGTSSGLRFLMSIEEALAVVLGRHPGVRLRVVCDRRPVFSRLPVDRVEFVPWSVAQEVEALQGMSIGLMPIAEDEWCLGKCSYKMLLYMACALPVVVTPWGMNRDVLALGDVGIGARGTGEWVDALDQLLRHRTLRNGLGTNGRAVVQRYFGLDALAPRLARLLDNVVARRA